MVRNTPTRVKDIWVKDTTAKAKVTLWREKCDLNVRPGDFVTISDVVTNVYKNETSFSITTRSVIEVMNLWFFKQVLFYRNPQLRQIFYVYYSILAYYKGGNHLYSLQYNFS